MHSRNFKLKNLNSLAQINYLSKSGVVVSSQALMHFEIWKASMIRYKLSNQIPECIKHGFNVRQL